MSKKRRDARHLAVNHTNHSENTNVVPLNKYLPKKKSRVMVYPKNLNQETYLFKLQEEQKSILFAIGPAGTGKTMIAVQWAIKLLQEGVIDKIVVTRPAVSVDEDLGFLPGTLEEKMAPWTRPIFDVFEEYYYAKEIAQMLEEGVIEISPLAYMRGRTFKNSFVIADEMQNTTPSQMKMLLTRLGEKSRMIVTGDLNQADRPSENGLLEFLKFYDDFKGSKFVDLCKFDSGDIERHPAVREILKIYGEK